VLLVETTAHEVEKVLEHYHGITDKARAEIREILKKHLSTLEYYVLVRPDGYGEIHTNHLREAVYFTDPVGLKCAAVEITEAFFTLGILANNWWMYPHLCTYKGKKPILCVQERF